jgi:hypothetical protein
MVSVGRRPNFVHSHQFAILHLTSFAVYSLLSLTDSSYSILGSHKHKHFLSLSNALGLMLSSRKRGASGDFEQPPKKKIKLSNGQNNPSSHVAMIRKGNTQKPVKKLVIKSFKVRPTLPTNFEEESWSALQDAIHAIQEKKPVSHSKQTLYDVSNQSFPPILPNSRIVFAVT